MSRVGAAVGAGAVIFSSLLVAAGPAQAVVDGTIVVNLVDQFGHPTTSAVVYAVDTSGSTFGPSSSPPLSSSFSISAPPGGYGLESLAPWSGVVCNGVAPCAGFGSPTVTPVLTVSSGVTTTVSMVLPLPTISGGDAIGSPLSLNIPPGLTSLEALAAAQSSMPGPHTQQWVRGATDIPGATGGSYVTTGADAAQPITARITAAPGVLAVFGPSGIPVTPFTTNAITTAKSATTTKAKAPKNVKVGEHVSVEVKVSASAGVPDGFVTLKIGTFGTKKKLKSGSVFIQLPRLSVGQYKISVKYAGSAAFIKSKAKHRTITVRA